MQYSWFSFEKTPQGYADVYARGLLLSRSRLANGIMMPIAGWLFDIAFGTAYLATALIALGRAVVAYFANKRIGVLCVA